MGYAVQLFHIRYLGWSYSAQTRIPSKVLNYIAEQLGEPIRAWNFKANYKRANTITRHFYEICKVYGYRELRKEDEANVFKMISANANVVDNRVFIVNEIISYLKSLMIILPKISTIEKWVQEVCNKNEDTINHLVYSQLSLSQKDSIRKALMCKGDSENKFNLHQLRNITGKITPKTFGEIVRRVEYIDSLNLNIDLSSISENKRKSITKRIFNRRISSLLRSNNKKIYPSIIIYLHETRKYLLDLAVEANDDILHNILRKKEIRGEKLIAEKIKELFGNVSDMLLALDTLSNALHNKKSVLSSLKKKGITLDALDEICKRGHELSRLQNNHMESLGSIYNEIRKYSTQLLKIINISSQDKDMQPLIDALDHLRYMNMSSNNSLQDDAPTEHIESKFLKYIRDENGNIDKKYYEIATLSSLRSAIRNNTVTVEGSEKYLSFDRDLIDKDTFASANDIFETLRGFRTFDEYYRDRKQTLEELLQFLNENIGVLEDLWVEKGHMHLSPLEAAVPEKAIDLSRYIFGDLVPDARLEEILLEVDKWTHFTRHFIHTNLKNQSIKPEDNEKILASIMGLGTNVGLTKMSKSMNKYTYDQLYNIVLNCIDENSIRLAQGDIVRYMRNLWVSEYWGEGNTSSSDGRGIKTIVSSPNSEYNPRHGINKGCSIYRFVCDKYYVFFTKVIRSNREFQQIIDGVLAHEEMTGTPVIEHYSDTGGYSDPLFGLAHLLGFSYAPRIKNISTRNLYISRKNTVGENIKHVTFKKINKQWIEEYYDDILRIAYSIKKGEVSGELVMRKLCNKSSKLRRAVVEMGRLEKTIFLLRFYTSPDLRRRIQIGLNKGEANNLLAKAVQFGNEGKFTVKEPSRQQLRASSLSLIMDAICVWNAVYLQRSIDYLESNGKLIDRSYLKHISPQNYEHINFLGRYDFSKEQSLPINVFRKLKIENNHKNIS